MYRITYNILYYCITSPCVVDTATAAINTITCLAHTILHYFCTVVHSCRLHIRFDCIKWCMKIIGNGLWNTLHLRGAIFETTESSRSRLVSGLTRRILPSSPRLQYWRCEGCVLLTPAGPSSSLIVPQETHWHRYTGCYLFVYVEIKKYYKIFIYCS